MKRGTSVFALLTALAACSAIPASAYYHFVYYLSSGSAPEKFDLTALPNKTVWFFVSESGPTSYSANDNFASVIGQIRQAAQVWNGVSSSDLRVGFGGFENARTQQNAPAADVVFDDLAPGVLALGGPTSLSTGITPAGGTTISDARMKATAPAASAPFVPITRSTIHLNVNGLVAPFPSYRQAFFLVLLHEMGHALGLQHTFTSATMSVATTSATSLMNPLDVDDVAGISSLYPNASFALTGSISGRITSGGNGLHLESVVAIRAGAGAVSALTNPDGTYEIDGIPPGQYYVYAHALPPDADIAGPWNQDGSIAAPSGPTNSLFYPGTTDLQQATPVAVTAGAIQPGIDIAVTSLPALPMYDVSVYGYYGNNSVPIKPAYLNTLAGETAVAASGVGPGWNDPASGIGAAFMGSSAIVANSAVQPYQASGHTYVAVDLDVGFSPFSATGPQHLIFSTPTFMHVLPAAVRLTQQVPPTIQSVAPNADGSLTISGTSWMSGSAIYFDGLPASVSTLNATAGIAIVTPPPGESGQTAILTVYNPDGQNSQFVQSANPLTYTYGDVPAQTISSISPASLPAGAEATVDIATAGFTFTDGEAALGFGTSDIAVRRVFVLGPNHLQADVSVAAGADLSSSDVSVFSGFETTTATAGFRITPAVYGLPAPIPVLTNALTGLTGAYPGAIVSLYGSNLQVAGATPVVTFDNQPAAILYSSPTQINLQIPGGVPSGLTTMNLYNGAAAAYPLTVNIDTPPATISGIEDSSGNAIGASLPALQGDFLTVSLSGFAPAGASVAASQVQVGVAGVMHPVLSVTQTAPGVFQVGFLLSQSEATGNSQPVVVYFNGRSSYPVTIPILASANPGLADSGS